MLNEFSNIKCTEDKVYIVYDGKNNSFLVHFLLFILVYQIL